MARGYVSMRNEDGTQYASIKHGGIQWVERKSEATLVSKQVFDIMEKNQENTRKRDCPDNGFFGVYCLAFKEVAK